MLKKTEVVQLENEEEQFGEHSGLNSEGVESEGERERPEFEWTMVLMVFGLIVSVISSIMLSLTLPGLEPGGAALNDYRLVKVTSESMEPNIRKNATCLVKLAGIDEVSVGDVIIYYTQTTEQYIIHRVTDVRTVDGELAVSTKGDNNSKPDPVIITEDMMRAKVVKIYNWAADLPF